MIIDVKKYLFIGMKSDLSGFFEKAQEKGFIQFISPTGRALLDSGSELANILKAIKILKGEPKHKMHLAVKDLVPKQIVERVIEVKERIVHLEESERILGSEIDRITPYGDFSIDELKALGDESGYFIQFFAVKTAKSNQMDIPPELIYISTEYDMDYFISFSKKIIVHPKMVELKFSKSLGDLEQQLIQEKVEHKVLAEELKELAGYLDYLNDHLIDITNDQSLAFAKEEISTAMDDHLFTVEAWVPKNKLRQLPALMKEHAVLAEEIAVENHDTVPTYMENEKTAKVGEDLVKVYDVPATSDRDPSKWVLWAFAFFFAIIVADAGYGSIYLALSLFCRWKFKSATGALKRGLTLFTILASSCVIWGILTASYFGIDFSPENPVRKASITYYLGVEKAEYHMREKDDVFREWVEKYPGLANVTSGSAFIEMGKTKQGKYEIMTQFYDNLLMEFALLIGVIHVILSLLRYLTRSYANVGWIACMIGGYLFFPSMLKATSILNFTGIISKATATEVGLQLMVGGLAVAVVVALIQFRLKGLEEITKIIQIFADVLSYLRLYALGLAGMILASTFNGMGEVVGYAAGFFIILIGHGINMVLGVMGGTIHGLRLNFLEWYHYSFEGGGKLFKPLKKVTRS